MRLGIFLGILTTRLLEFIQRWLAEVFVFYVTLAEKSSDWCDSSVTGTIVYKR